MLPGRRSPPSGLKRQRDRLQRDRVQRASSPGFFDSGSLAVSGTENERGATPGLNTSAPMFTRDISATHGSQGSIGLLDAKYGPSPLVSPIAWGPS